LIHYFDNWEDNLNQLGQQRMPFLFFIDFKGENVWVEENPISKKDMLFDFNGVSNLYERGNENLEYFKFLKEPISKPEYTKMFDQVYKEIQFGNTFLINLTSRTSIDTELTLLDIFSRSQAKYKLLYPDHFVCYSPETFIKIIDNTIYTFPMKGTIDAALPKAKMTILSDEKEKSEHYTIVDLLRNDLSMVAKDVRVHQFRYVEKVKTNQKTLLQVSSEIRGTLNSDWNASLGSLLKKLLPAGSISGAPKAKTIEIIERIEHQSRGWYTGICGYFDGNTLDTGVMIRFIEVNDGKLYFRSGGGITHMSDPNTEYKEMVDKVYLSF
jgi:para-aminobenzoate synthetase component I